MKAKEFLRTIWFQEPKKYHEEATCSAMEQYANQRVIEEKSNEVYLFNMWKMAQEYNCDDFKNIVKNRLKELKQE